MKLILGILALISATSASAQDARYRHIDNPPDPAAQLAEMVALYDRICLTLFPDDEAVAEAMAAAGATPLDKPALAIFLHDDPGTGWHLAGRSAAFDVTVEAPPYHACTIRTVTAAGFPDLAPYRQLADRFEGRKGFKKMPMRSHVAEGVASVMGGDFRGLAGGGGESLLVVSATPTAEHRAHGEDATEIRFVHQIASPGAR